MRGGILSSLLGIAALLGKLAAGSFLPAFPLPLPSPADDPNALRHKYTIVPAYLSQLIPTPSLPAPTGGCVVRTWWVHPPKRVSSLTCFLPVPVPDLFVCIFDALVAIPAAHREAVN